MLEVLSHPILLLMFPFRLGPPTIRLAGLHSEKYADVYIFLRFSRVVSTVFELHWGLKMTFPKWRWNFCRFVLGVIFILWFSLVGFCNPKD